MVASRLAVPARSARSRPGHKRSSSGATPARQLVETSLDQLQMPLGMPVAPPALDTNVIYCEDNLTRMSLLPGESIDMVYLDPPFFSNRQYEVIWGDEAEVR